MTLKVAEFDNLPPERMKDYKGRIRTWPRVLLMLVIVCGALTLITHQAMEENEMTQLNVIRYEQHMQKYRKIKDGQEDDQVPISDDGQVGNPKSYPNMSYDFLQAVDMLTKNLCESRYWNILGLDLKNEPHTSSWGGDDPDWQKGAMLIGNRMLEGCPNWLAFVVGVNGVHEVTVTGDRTDDFYDWWGGGLEDAGDNLIEYKVDNKLESGILKGYEELSDEVLKANVEITMDLMFGYLMNKTSSAMVLGEFAGLYATDAHPNLTTKRTTDYNIQ
ncbi:hypothetical protein PHYPSEUDO_008895 [Phytophthora pseudosyringae]|uniref:Glycoside hydrolase family 5 domain-containing protein n=1 Tax=Phytophthora pseudosyringae TaxID=221518 RepID=A0A8T1VGD2_9STRA|nr:hypothetical protein PHYPSEUDO_008895 [Phytophthora pseudosyringae]